MVIAYGPSSDRRAFVHLFEPPMGAGQARKRLEEMHTSAKQGLGYVSRRHDSRLRQRVS